MNDKLEILKNLKTGDAFMYEHLPFIALGLVDTLASHDVFCLDVIRREIKKIAGNTPVKLIDNWYITSAYQTPDFRRGEALQPIK